MSDCGCLLRPCYHDLRAELAAAHDELLARDRAYVNTLTAIARVRELCTSPIDERVWSHEVYAAVLHALDPAGEPPPSG